MSDQQVIAASVQVDTEAAQREVLKLQGTVADLKKEFKNAQAGSDEQITAFKKLQSAQDDLGKATKKLSDLQQGSSGHFKNLKDNISALPGPTQAASKSVGGLTEAFNILKAHPIIGVFVLLAGLVVALFQKFKSMEAVSDSLGKAFGSLSGLMSAFLNKILTPLIDGFVKAVDLITKAGNFLVGIFSPSLAEASKRSGELAEALDDLNDAEADSAIARAESNRKLQEARELAEDANVPIKDRIKALKEAGKIEKEELDKSILIATQRAQIMLEQIGIELGVRKELIDSIKNGSIEQLKAARNEIMAMKNVDKEKLKAIDALLIQAENEGAQRSKIAKKTQASISSLEKQDASDRKAARDKAAAEAKAQEQKLAEFRTKLKQLQQDNELSQIKDGYEKELRALEIKLENEKKLNEDGVKQGRLTRQQAILLDAELEKQAQIKRNELKEKHDKETADKEAAFQAQLKKLKQEIVLGGIVDQRQLESEQLKINYEQSLEDAKKLYADNAEKFAQVKALIDEKYRQDQKKQDDKNREEDAKKALEDSLKNVDKVINDPESELETKQAALDAELVILRKAFDDKLLTEEDYNNKVAALAQKRIEIGEMEGEFKKKQATEVADTLNNLSEVVGKQTVAGKALAVATALINTYQGASEAIKQKSTLPSPFDVIAKVANVAAVIATGLKTVKAITAVQVPGHGGGGSASSAASVGVTAPLPPTPGSTKLNQEAINKQNNAADGGVNRQPVRAYIVDGDIQSQAERNARLERAAKLGG